MKKKLDRIIIEQEPRERRLVHDAMWLSSKRSPIHGWLKVDFTEVENELKRLYDLYQFPLTLATYIAWTYAKTLEQCNWANIMRTRRGRIYRFEDVDLTYIMEFEGEGEKILLPRIFRKVNQLSVWELEYKIRQTTKKQHKANALESWMMGLPTWLRRALYDIMLADPINYARYYGTSGFTSLMNTGNLPGFIGVPQPLHAMYALANTRFTEPTLQPDGSVAMRTYCEVTLVCDHLLIDGANLVRFGQRWKENATIDLFPTLETDLLAWIAKNKTR